jgi:nucleotide-binding universal stress UspA family protein
MNQRIVVAADGSEGSLRAVDAAADLARAIGAKLVVTHVVDSAKAATMCFGEAQLLAGCFDALREEGRHIVADAVARARRIVTEPEQVESRIVQGSPVEEIVRLAGEGRADWIVMGSHGRSGLARALMGSIAEGVLREAPVPVMIVPSGQRAERAAVKPPVADSAQAAT